jgi:hypothetical protein
LEKSFSSQQMTAYSYVRFSSGKQAKGHSLERQTQKPREVCVQKGWKLDTDLIKPDVAVSGYKAGKSNIHVGNPARKVGSLAMPSLVFRLKIQAGLDRLVYGLHQLFRDWIQERHPVKIQFMGLFRFALASAALFLVSINTHADIVYVWSNDGTIQKFNANGVGALFTTNNLSGWNGPVGLALDNVGNLYAGVPGESHIWKFLPSGTRSLIGYIDSISGLAFDSTGNLFATSPNYIEIGKCVYGQAWGYSAIYFDFSPYSQSHLTYPINLAFDGGGNIYVVNNTNASPIAYLYSPSPYDNTIQRFASNLTPIGAFAANLNNPWGLAFDSSGDLYVSSSGDDLIYRFTPSGYGSIFGDGSASLSGPRGLAFDSGGNLYVANAGSGTIVKITPGGTGSVFASGLIEPTSIAIFPSLNLWSATAITLNNPLTTPSGTFRFDFTDNPGLAFTVLGTTNGSSPLTNWTILGSVTEVSTGLYQFIDSQATNGSQRFYRIVAP